MGVFTVAGTPLHADRITWLQALPGNRTRVLFDGRSQVVVDAPRSEVAAAWEDAVSAIVGPQGPTGPTGPTGPAPTAYRETWSIMPAQTTTEAYSGCHPVSVSGGTLTTPAPTSGSALNLSRRTVRASAASIGALAYRAGGPAHLTLHRSTGGGFRVRHTVAITTSPAGWRGFVGVVASSATPTSVDPLTSTALSRVGLAVENGGASSVWSLVVCDAGNPPAVTATTIPAGSLMQLTITGSASGYTIHAVDIGTGTTFTATVTTGIPVADTMMAPTIWAATTVASAVAFATAGLVVDHGLVV